MRCCSRQQKNYFISSPGKIIQAAAILTAACNYEVIFIRIRLPSVLFNNSDNYGNNDNYCDNSCYNALYHEFYPPFFKYGESIKPLCQPFVL